MHIDLSSIAQVLQPGHRLGLLISAGSAIDHISPYAPVITIHGGSRLEISTAK